MKFNDNEGILSYATRTQYYIIKLEISEKQNKTTFLDKREYYTSKKDSSNFHNYNQILINKDNNLILLIIYENIGEIYQLGYSSCKNKEITLYNGDKSPVNFDISPGLFKGYDNDIVFINNKTIYNSLIYNSGAEHIKTETIYNKNNISFYFNEKDYDDIKKDRLYNIIFRNTLSPKESETCTLTLKFYECDKECDICTITKCYDKFRNLIDRDSSSSEVGETPKFVYIVSALIFIPIFSLIILILLAFMCSLKNNHNRNRNNPNIANNERFLIN